MAGERPLRILHVVGGMVRAGTETWLMNILRQTDRSRFALDFLVHTDEPCDYDAEIAALGSRVLRCAHPNRPPGYARTFRRIVQEYGPYDVIHCHLMHYCGFVLRLAHRAGISVRLAHSHNDTTDVEATAGPARQLYLALMRRWIDRHATGGLAASGRAAAALFGARWAADLRVRTLPCGIDLAPFRRPPGPAERAAARAALGLPADALVLGHVGRLAPQKNHALLLEAAAVVAAREPRARLLLVGDGPLRAAITHRAAARDLAGRVALAGSRADVPRLLAAMDIFLFPSHFEGLGLALVEAQAAGLPCLASAAVPPEADLAPALVRRLPAASSPTDWARAALAASAMDRPDQATVLAQIERTPWNITTSIRQLEEVYRVADQRPQPGLHGGSQPA